MGEHAHAVDKYVLDTSVIVDGRITEEVRSGALSGTGATFIVPEVVVAELEAQAARGQEIGYAGLKELRTLQRLQGECAFKLLYRGERPAAEESLEATSTAIDAQVRDLAESEGGTLVTSNPTQALVAEAKGIPVRYYGRTEADGNLEGMRLLEFFDEQTMSVHLRAGAPPKAKCGTPGHMEIRYLRREPLRERELERMAHEIVELAEIHPQGFIEMDLGGSTVVQLANLRIAIARPPFSDALEITAVRPVARTRLEDYQNADLLRARLREKYRGVLVSGAPGAGKSTFVQAVASALEAEGWIVKTMEKPRDLEVGAEITQYTALGGEMVNTADVLLLVRPDYTIFDEMRQTSDFQVFADMRLAGVGLVGVVHATRGIDALQRLIGRVELGMIPQVVDTVVYIEDGDVREIYEVDFTVKVPSGMGDSDLARPVIEVREFDTKSLAYEIYTFGDQVVVMPLKLGQEERPLWRLAARELERQLGKLLRAPVAVELTSSERATVYVDDYLRPQILGRGGKRIAELEARLGLRLDVRSFQEMDASSGRQVEVSVTDRHVIVDVSPGLRNKTIELLVDGESVFIGSASKSGSIKLLRGTEPAEHVYRAHRGGATIRARRVR